MSARKKRLTPKDCTKEELCAYLSCCVPYERSGSAYIHDTLDTFVRHRRYENAYQAMQKATKEVLLAMERYSALSAPYAGRKISSLPASVRDQIIAQGEKVKRLSEREERLTKAWEKMGNAL